MAAPRVRRLVALALGAVVLLLPMTVSAERIASRGDDANGARPAQLARVHEALSNPDVAKALAAQGLSAAEVERRLAQLSNEDVARLAANLDQVQAAGNVPQYIWILLAVFLAVSILVMIF